MSLKVITPIDIDDSNMNSSIPDIDSSQGEVEFIADKFTVVNLLETGALTVCSAGGSTFVRGDVPQSPEESILRFRRYTATGYGGVGYYYASNLRDNEFGALVANSGTTLAVIGQLIDGFSTFSAGDVIISNIDLTDYTDKGQYYNITENHPDLLSSIAFATYDDDEIRVVGKNESYSSGYAVLTTDVSLPGVATVAELKLGVAMEITGSAIINGQFNILGKSQGRLVLAEMGNGLLSDPSSVSYFDLKYKSAGDYDGLCTISGELYTLIKSDFKLIKMNTNPFNIVYGYDAGERVTLEKSIYEATATTIDNPEIGAQLIPPTWVEVSATNKYKAFDYVINTKSIMSASTAAFTFTPSQPATNIALFGLEDVTRVYVEVRENDAAGAIIYNEYSDLAIDSPIADSIVNSGLLGDKVLFDDLPVYATPFITVTFDSDKDEIKVGDIVIGNSRTLGVTTYQSSTSRTSYDTVDTDDFGNESITSRPSAEYTSFEVVVFPEYANYVERILKDSLNKPRVWIGDKPNDEKIFTFGYYERSPITYSSPAQYETTLKVRGLV